MLKQRREYRVYFKLGITSNLRGALWENVLNIKFHLLQPRKMSQIQAKKKIDLYYRMRKTSYEQFINKKWVERKDIFETKKSFIKREDANWKRKCL